MKRERDLRVYAMSGYNYEATPTIMLKGKWLREFGFDAGREFRVTCDDGRLIIEAKETPEPYVAPEPKRKNIK